MVVVSGAGVTTVVVGAGVELVVVVVVASVAAVTASFRLGRNGLKDDGLRSDSVRFTTTCRQSNSRRRKEDAPTNERNRVES